MCNLFEPVISDDYTTLEQMRIEHDLRMENMVSAFTRYEVNESIAQLNREGVTPDIVLHHPQVTVEGSVISGNNILTMSIAEHRHLHRYYGYRQDSNS